MDLPDGIASRHSSSSSSPPGIVSMEELRPVGFLCLVKSLKCSRGHGMSRPVDVDDD